MRLTRLVIFGFITATGLGLSACGSLASFTSEGLVDEYSIPQNRSLAIPSDFSMLPVPQSQLVEETALPTPEEIEALMFQLEPEPEPEYVPLTIVQGEIPEYRPIGRIVASGSNGAAAQALVSPSLNASGSLYPVTATSQTVPSVAPAAAPQASVASAASVASGQGAMVLSPEDVAALSALAVGQAMPASGLGAGAGQAAPQAGAQMVTSLPAGVTVVGSPVVLSR